MPSRVSLQVDIVAEIGLPYPSALGLRHRSRRGQEKAMFRKKKKGKCGERGEEDDSDDGESDDCTDTTVNASTTLRRSTTLRATTPRTTPRTTPSPPRRRHTRPIRSTKTRTEDLSSFRLFIQYPEPVTATPFQ
jgi:hypothetical protein